MTTLPKVHTYRSITPKHEIAHLIQKSTVPAALSSLAKVFGNFLRGYAPVLPQEHRQGQAQMIGDKTWL